MDCPYTLRRLGERKAQEVSTKNKGLRTLQRTPVSNRSHGIDNKGDGRKEIVEGEEYEEIQRRWFSFHEAANHNSYEDLYSKAVYCLQLRSDSLSNERFLELISDQDFLFLDCCEAKGVQGYPRYSTLVRSGEVADGQKDATPSKSGLSDSKMDEKILREMMIPSKANKASLQKLDKNLEQLDNAWKLRKDQKERFSTDIQPFDISICSDSEPLNSTEKSLCLLFREYALACRDSAFVKWSNRIEKEEERFPWQNAVHCVYSYLKNHPSLLPGFEALVFFHLFSQNGEKLLGGSLHLYHFKEMKIRTTMKEDPERTQLRINRRVSVNIQLYDQLLSYLSPEEANEQYELDAKFLFYRFSHYDRYWHYSVSDLRTYCRLGDIPPFTFQGNRNYEDGVDNFGNLLRNNIRKCIPNGTEQLTPQLGIVVNTYYSDFTIFLLRERFLKKSGLVITEMIQRAVDEKPEEYLKYYLEVCGDHTMTTIRLRNWCQELNIFAQLEDILEEASRPFREAIGMQMLEFAIRSIAVQKSVENLESVAELLFSDCLY